MTTDPKPVDQLDTRGTVAVVNRPRGYAIITLEDGTEYFGHVHEFVTAGDFDSLDRGSAVWFEPFHDPRGKGNGLRARRIRRAL